jgi:hypothetical protein
MSPKADAATLTGPDTFAAGDSYGTFTGTGYPPETIVLVNRDTIGGGTLAYSVWADQQGQLVIRDTLDGEGAYRLETYVRNRPNRRWELAAEHTYQVVPV